VEHSSHRRTVVRLSRVLVLAGALVILSLVPATVARANGCSVSNDANEICAASFNATADNLSQYVVAQYADYSNCDFPPLPGEPGNNGRYTVASITINWGDGTPPTSGTAVTGSTCPGTGPPNYGEPEPIEGTHEYQKSGTYTVSVSITYVRGTGNTFANCATWTPGDTTYNNLTNCIATGAPVQSTANVGGGGAVASSVAIAGATKQCDVPCSPTVTYRATDASGNGVSGAKVQVTVIGTYGDTIKTFTETSGLLGLGIFRVPALTQVDDGCPGSSHWCAGPGQYRIIVQPVDAAGVVDPTGGAAVVVETHPTKISRLYVSPGTGNQLAGVLGLLANPYYPQGQPGIVPIIAAVFDEFGNQYYEDPQHQVPVRFIVKDQSTFSDSIFARYIQPFGIDPNYTCDPSIFPDMTFINQGMAGAQLDQDPPTAQAQAVDLTEYTELGKPLPCAHLPSNPNAAGTLFPFEPFVRAPSPTDNAGAWIYMRPDSEGSQTTRWDVIVEAQGADGVWVSGNTAALPQTFVEFLDPQAASDKETGRAANVFLSAVDVFACGVGLIAEVPTDGLSTGLTIWGCGRSVFSLADDAVLQQDAPDPKVNAIFLPPRSRPPTPTHRTRCYSAPRHITCASLIAAERSYAAALSGAASLQEASAVAIDRYGGGIKSGAGYQMLAQQAAAYVYLADLKGAYRHVAHAGRQLGALLRGSGRDITLSAQQVAKLREGLVQLKGIPKATITELYRLGIAPSPTDIAAAIKAAFVDAGPPRSMRLSTTLETEPRLSGFVTQEQKLTPLNLQALGDTLAGQRAISAHTKSILDRDAKALEKACTAATRTRAARHFIGAAKHHSHGGARSLLEQAASTLTRYDKGTSPSLPPCAGRPSPSPIIETEPPTS
jgi:hypothetical protein